MSKNSLLKNFIATLSTRLRQYFFGGSLFAAMAFLPMHLQAANYTLPPDITTPIVLSSGVNNFTIVDGDTGTVSGNISGGGNLTKLDLGTLWLTGNNTFIGGTVLKGGTIGLGSNTALGTWVAGNPTLTQNGLVYVTDGTSTIKITENRTITNHFQLGTTTNRTGNLVFDISPDATLIINGVENTLSNTALANGGAINVNVGGSGTDCPLMFTGGGHVVFSDNKAVHYGGAVGVYLDGGGASVLNFSDLSSLKFLGNIVTGDSSSIQCYGGGISSEAYWFPSYSSVTLGSNVTFSDNIAGIDKYGVGGGIYSYGPSYSLVTLGSQAMFSGNIAGKNHIGSGGGIYSFSNSYSSVILGSGATFLGNIAGSGDDGFGGGIYSSTAASDSSVILGSHTTFSGNIAGNMAFGSGGGISSVSPTSSFVILDSHTAFTDNRAGGNNIGGEGGAIRIYGNDSAELYVSGHTLFDGNLVSRSGSVSRGGAISIGTNMSDMGIVTLNAADGAIAFRNNKVDVDTSNLNDLQGGTANSIHLMWNILLDLQGDGNIYFDDPISSGTDGRNSLVKSGNGFVQFVGNNRLNTTGYTTTANSVDIQSGIFRVVNSGSESFDASGAGRFNVGTGGTLAGAGTIISGSGGFTISGTISPDSDRFEIPDWVGTVNGVNVNTFAQGRTTLAADKTVGTLTLRGNTNFTGATFNIDVTSNTSYDKIIVQNGTISGSSNTVKISATGLTRGNTDIWFLEGTGAESLFSDTTLTSTNSRYAFQLISATNMLGCQITVGGYRDTYDDDLSPNGERLASLIDNLPPGTPFLDALDLVTDDASIISAIENATGEGYAMSMQSIASLQRVFNESLLTRKIYENHKQELVILGQNSFCNRLAKYEIWGRITGGSHDRSNIGRYSGYDLSHYGVSLGIEREIGARWFGGVALGYDHADLNLDDRFARNKFEAFRVSLYGGFTGRNRYTSGYIGYAKDWHDMRRNNPVLGFSNRGKYDDNVFSIGSEVGKILKWGDRNQLITSFGVHWIHLDNPDFTENGSSASALYLSKTQFDSVRMPVGARLNKTLTTHSISWTPEVRAFYVAELGDTRSGLDTAFVSSRRTGSALADSGNGGRSSATLGTGVMAQITNGLSMTLDYDYEIWEHYDRHNLVGNITYRW